MHKNNIQPSFMIIGAPKCGTTALYHYLSEHPQVCFSDSKEPNYFCTDFPGYRNSFSIDEYLTKEFSHCQPENIQAIGEGSVCYLYSKTAINEIIKFNSDIKFIVMLRNPVDVVQSLHSQMYYNLDENIADFETAWRAQEQRKTGENIPPLCREPLFLQYRDFAMFGKQIKRLLDQAPRNQVKIIFFNDFIQNTRQIYLDTLEFIGVKDDGRTQFPKINENKQSRSRIISRFIHRPPKFVTALTKWAKNITGIKRFGVYKLAACLGDKFNAQTTTRTQPPEALKRVLIHEFNSDIIELERITGKDLSAWKE